MAVHVALADMVVITVIAGSAIDWTIVIVTVDGSIAGFEAEVPLCRRPSTLPTRLFSVATLTTVSRRLFALYILAIREPKLI